MLVTEMGSFSAAHAASMSGSRRSRRSWRTLSTRRNKRETSNKKKITKTKTNENIVYIYIYIQEQYLHTTHKQRKTKPQSRRGPPRGRTHPLTLSGEQIAFGWRAGLELMSASTTAPLTSSVQGSTLRYAWDAS